MPRLPPSLLHHASKISSLLPLILRGARTLESSINELRWLKEYVSSLNPISPRKSHQTLLRLCQQRSKGEPLQYILGSQPFGELDIRCRPGVLIPRPETESYTTHLAHLALTHKLGLKTKHPKAKIKIKHPKAKIINANNNATATTPTPKPPLRILDICSGSGCISLLLHPLLSHTFALTITGLDISPAAISLSNANLEHNIKLSHINSSASLRTQSQEPEIQFIRTDTFQNLPECIGEIDILISNPPYISPSHYNSQTSRSVRNWEPKLALVPNNPNPDIFYERLIRVFQIHLAKVLVMEVGDAEQGVRVAEMAFRFNGTAWGTAPRVWGRVEIWRDQLVGLEGDEDGSVVKELDGREMKIRGQGKVRAVVLFRETTDRHEHYKKMLERRVVRRLDGLGGEEGVLEKRRGTRGERGRRVRCGGSVVKGRWGGIVRSGKDLEKVREKAKRKKRGAGRFGMV